MTDNDLDEFFELLDATFDLMGKTPAAKVVSPTAKALFFRALEQYPIEQVRAGFEAHIREGTFTPVPNDIAQQIERRMPVQWIAADEAWARIPKPATPRKFKDWQGKTAIDYRSAEWPPCILNQVTVQALAVAAPMLEAGDEIAARMAFRSCYDRLVEQERLHRRAPANFISPGGSHEERQALAAEGVRLGLLPMSHAPKVDETRALPSPQAQSQLRQIKLMIAARPMPKPEDKDYE